MELPHDTIDVNASLSERNGMLSSSSSVVDLIDSGLLKESIDQRREEGLHRRGQVFTITTHPEYILTSLMDVLRRIPGSPF